MAETMPSESRKPVAALRKYCQDELEEMIRMMRLEGGTLDDCVAELHLFADFVRAQAEALPAAWHTMFGNSGDDWLKMMIETGQIVDRRTGEPNPPKPASTEQLKVLELFGTIEYDVPGKSDAT